jgi:hypothetical protein
MALAGAVGSGYPGGVLVVELAAGAEPGQRDERQSGWGTRQPGEVLTKWWQMPYPADGPRAIPAVLYSLSRMSLVCSRLVPVAL